MAMLEGTRLSFSIGYKTHLKNKMQIENFNYLLKKNANMKNNRNLKMNFSFFQI